MNHEVFSAIVLVLLGIAVVSNLVITIRQVLRSEPSGTFVSEWFFRRDGWFDSGMVALWAAFCGVLLLVA